MRKRKREPRYASGDCTLGWRGKEAVAQYRNEKTRRRERVRLGVFKRDGEQKVRAALDHFAETRRALQAQAAVPTIGELWALWLRDREADGFPNALYTHQWKALAPTFANRDWALCRHWMAKAQAQKGA